MLKRLNLLMKKNYNLFKCKFSIKNKFYKIKLVLIVHFYMFRLHLRLNKVNNKMFNIVYHHSCLVTFFLLYSIDNYNNNRLIITTKMTC